MGAASGLGLARVGVGDQLGVQSPKRDLDQRHVGCPKPDLLAVDIGEAEEPAFLKPYLCLQPKRP